MDGGGGSGGGYEGCGFAPVIESAWDIPPLGCKNRSIVPFLPHINTSDFFINNLHFFFYS